MSIVQVVFTQAQQDEITAYINKYRAINQAPPLTYDSTISAVSSQWATNLITTKTFKHSGNTLYGENLAYYMGYGTDAMTLVKKAVDQWYDEIKLYDFNNPGFSEATGHFTCLVWVASKTFGMGITINTGTNEADVVMNTSPPGNYAGQYVENVLAPTSVPTPTPTPTPVPEPILKTKADILNALVALCQAVQAKKNNIALAILIGQIIGAVKSYMPTSSIKNYIISLLYTINTFIQTNQKLYLICSYTLIIMQYMRYVSF